MARTTRGSRAGFTLLEVLIAILIVGVVAMVLLYRRIDVVRDAGRIRDERVAWTLAALKLGELSRDVALLKDSDSGDFTDVAPDQAAFRWSYESEVVPIVFDDAQAPSAETPVRVVRRVRLKILDPEDVELSAIEAMFPDAPAEETP